MGLWSNIWSLRSLNPAIQSPWKTAPSTLNSVVWPDLYGADYLPVTRMEAMSIPAVSRARGLICATAASLPGYVYQGSEPVADQPPWLMRSDHMAALPPAIRMVWTLDDLFFYGWSLWSAIRDESGALVAADRVAWDSWDFDTDGTLLVGDQQVRPQDYILIPGMDEGFLVRAATTVRQYRSLLTTADRTAGKPASFVELHQTNDRPMTDAQIEDMVAKWNAVLRKGEGAAYTNSAIELNVHGGADANLVIEGRNAAAVDVARHAGVPASLLDATGVAEGRTYENSEGRNQQFLDYGLRPFLAAIQARLGMDDVTEPGQRFVIDTSEYTGPIADAVIEPNDDNAPVPPRARRAAREVETTP